MSNQKLHYGAPAKEYMSGLPIGTGRLAAMVLGGLPERVALNHEWLWRGRQRQREPEKNAHRLEEVRQLLRARQWAEGTRLANELFGGGGGISGRPNRVDPYQPAGDLCFALDHGAIVDYRRELDLHSGLLKVQYSADGARFTRSYLAHIDLDVLLVHVACERPLSGQFWLQRQEDADCFLRRETAVDALVMDGQFEGGIGFRVQAQLYAEGATARVGEGERVYVEGAREILVAINIGTSAGTLSPASECRRLDLAGCSWSELLATGAAAQQKLCGGLVLDVDVPSVDRPTDERLAAARAGGQDPGLALLYFNYGRYLLVASTATAELPPNLQGKWNEDLDPPWQCDYHHDVNLQMAYWPAESGHLHYTCEALFRHVERFVPHARKAARDLYGCAGIYLPIQTDPWGRSTPESCGWSVWIGAAAWLAQHFWWHYEYGRDRDYLRDRAYPLLKEVAAFYESYLTADGAGHLQIVPSQSPENRFVGGDDKWPVTLGVSAAMDVQLARDLLKHALAAAELLAVDADKCAQWRSMLEALPPLQIGEHGQLMEWNEDFAEVEKGHRHYSHLFALYPGDELDPERTPELWRAARVALERRLANEGGHTGWSRSWTACLYARLGLADRAWEHVQRLILDFATDSLLDLHPPRIFQIDGNFGGVAAMLEMILQSYGGELHLLPALPAAWANGSCRGLRARGGYQIDMEWRDGLLQRAELTAIESGRICILQAADRYKIRTVTGAEIASTIEGHRLFFSAEAGQSYVVEPC